MKILRNFCRQHAGREARRATPALLGLNTAMSPSAAIDALEDQMLAERLLAMPPLTREVFLLRTVDGMSFEEISYHLAIARWRVRSHMRRAITRLAARAEV
jgi:RNA polymerase sigma factor (sigma-70 family)